MNDVTDPADPPRVKAAAPGRRRLGLRNEIVILLPVATLVLVALSTFTLFSFRNALDQLAEERRSETAHLARDVAQNAGSTPEELHRLVPFALGAAVGDESGRVLAKTGDFQGSDVLAPLHGRYPATPIAVGPGDELPGIVAGFAPYGTPGVSRVLRVDMAAPALDAQTRGLAVLTWVVLVLSAALAVLMVVFLRYALQPYDALLAQARNAAGSPGESDEMDFLVTTFERALQALARQGVPPAADDIAAIGRALAPSLESGVLLLDSHGTVLALNPAGAALLDLESPTPGTPLAVLLATQPGLRDVLADAVTAGRAERRRETTITNAAGPRIVGLTVHPLRRDEGSIRGYLVLFADLTEVRKTEEESRLAESLTRLGELSAGVAHELRNGLATLRGYLTLIERRPDEEAIADYFGEIRRETDHLQRVVSDFLAFAQPGTTRLENLDLETVARSAANDPALGGAEIEIRVWQHPLPILGDAVLLERALRNLLHNAVDAQASIDCVLPIRMTLEMRTDGPSIAVEDRGPGVKPEIRDRLFLPFVSGRADGVGLGLALTHRIIHLHGGSITLLDRVAGGTVARVTLRPGSPS